MNCPKISLVTPFGMNSSHERASTKSQKLFGGQISTHVEEYFVKAIMGEVNIDDTWGNYVKEWGSLGGSKCETEVNEWYTAKKSA